MRKIVAALGMTACLGSLGTWGCAQILPTIEVPLDFFLSLGVEAGVPANVPFDFDFEPEAQAGRGTIEIDPASITLQEAANGGGKVRQTTYQTVEDCTTACLAAGVPTATCDTVCANNHLLITVWIGTTPDITASCEDGEQHVFDVTLDDDGVPTSVAVTPSRLSDTSIGLINGGNFSICIEVISPVDGTVLLDGLILNLGL